MTDLGILPAIRRFIIDTSEINLPIYLTLPPKPQYPCLHVGLKSIHENPSSGMNQALSSVSFFIHYYTIAHTNHEPLSACRKLASSLNGRTLGIGEQYVAYIKSSGTVIDLPMVRSPRVFQQSYQAIIWLRGCDD